MDTSIILILLTLVVGLGIAMVFLAPKGSLPLIKSSSGSQIVIVGEMGSGKTVFFEYLRSGRVLNTVHSLQVNQAEIPATALGLDTPFEFVDIPGHGSFRSEYEKTFAKARAVLFFVDAQNDLRLSEAAHHLYNVLTSRALVKRQVPIIIACNKTDVPGAASANRIKSILETNLEKIRRSRAGTGQAFIAAAGRRSGLDEDEDGPAPTLGKPLTGPGASTAPFVFSDSVCPVSFASLSVKSGDLNELREVVSSTV